MSASERRWRTGGALLAVAIAAFLLPRGTAAAPGDGPLVPDSVWTGEEVYREACANCHGVDGRGASVTRLGFDTPLPDFTDCSFATREPDADWIAVAHDGGPVRGFARIMPALGDALTMEELQRAMDHIRQFCPDDSWPRGELNLPRALVTEKAYPEDEAVFTTVVDAEGSGSVMNEVVYERRFGARNQVEIVVPFGWRERTRTADGGAVSDWTGGIGDMAVGIKRDVYHDLGSGTIVSLAAEAILPTGDEDDGFGKGTTVFEPFVSVGQILPAGAFLHAQGGLELPADATKGQEEGFWRLALGRTFTEGQFGRAWSPMVELLASRELTSGEATHWDLLPQLQVTLNTRQHVMANVGVRIPLDDADVRSTQVMVYLLWDWFDGGLFAGW